MSSQDQLNPVDPLLASNVAQRDFNRFRQCHFQSAAQCGGRHIPLSLAIKSGEHRYHLLAFETISTDQRFERRWAMTLLQNVTAMLRSDYEQRSDSKMFELQESHINTGSSSDSRFSAGLRISKLSMRTGKIFDSRATGNQR